jgi:hypothetical protein
VRTRPHSHHPDRCPDPPAAGPVPCAPRRSSTGRRSRPFTTPSCSRSYTRARSSSCACTACSPRCSCAASTRPATRARRASRRTGAPRAQVSPLRGALRSAVATGVRSRRVAGRRQAGACWSPTRATPIGRRSWGPQARSSGGGRGTGRGFERTQSRRCTRISPKGLTCGLHSRCASWTRS